MIPKIIHYCWFGRNPLPELAQVCIASWRKFLPDYEIKEWNENNFNVNMIPYTAEAYAKKKYAFVSDYARFWIMYHFGGIYFDTDVEVIRPMDEIIMQGNFMGFETDPDGENSPGKYAPRYCYTVALGLGFGMEKSHPFMQRMLTYYESLHFEMPPVNIAWYKTIVAYTTEQLCDVGLRNVPGIQRVGDITVYPREYFAPINVITGRMRITDHTYTIHRYAGSWNAKEENLKETVKHYIKSVIPDCVFLLLNRYKRRKYRIPSEKRELL